MTSVRNLFFLFAVTLFAITSTILAIYNYNPFTSGLSVFINLYAALFVSLAGVMSLAIYYLKISHRKNQSTATLFWPTIRQASLISLALTILLALKGLGILDFLIAISIIIVLALLELFFRTKRRSS